MPPLFTSIGPFSLHTYTLWVGLAIGAALALAALNRRDRAGAVLDCGLLALAAGVIGARAVHVGLHWDYFVQHADEIARLRAGGLAWAGAVIGGLGGLALGARWRRISLMGLLEALTPALPLIGLAAWWGCWATGCAYGAEVATLADHPGWLVSEAPDIYGIIAPRYHTQLYGAAGSLALLLLTALMIGRGWLKGRRFGLLLALTALLSFGVGFWRADAAPVAAGLRADQWLDLLLLGLGLILFIKGHADNDS